MRKIKLWNARKSKWLQLYCNYTLSLLYFGASSVMNWMENKLTAKEKATDPTPRWKVPSPTCCRVARVLESQMWTQSCRGYTHVDTGSVHCALTASTHTWAACEWISAASCQQSSGPATVRKEKQVPQTHHGFRTQRHRHRQSEVWTPSHAISVFFVFFLSWQLSPLQIEEDVKLKTSNI